MSTAPAGDPTGGIAPDWLIRFTQRGEDALDALATELTARCSGTPEGIAELLDQVLHADISELANSLTAPADQPLVIDTDLAQAPETPRRANAPSSGPSPGPAVGRRSGRTTVDPPLSLRPSGTELAAGTAPQRRRHVGARAAPAARRRQA